LPAEEAASVIEALQRDPDFTPANGLTVRVAPRPILTPEFSVPPGVSAYFWSDTTYEWAGIQMLGEQATFESRFPSADTARAADTVAQETPITPAKVWGTAFEGVSLNSRGLQLRYSLAASGPVSVEVYGLNGRTFRRWSWREDAPGRFQRTFDLEQQLGSVAFARWTYGKVQIIRRIVSAQKTEH